MKKIIYLLMSILLIGIVSAQDECGRSVITDVDCSIVTPVMTCGTYTIDIFNSSGSLISDDKLLTQIGSSNIYNATFNFGVLDTYIVALSCDQASRTIIVIDEDLIAPSASFWSYMLMVYYNTLPGAW